MGKKLGMDTKSKWLVFGIVSAVTVIGAGTAIGFFTKTNNRTNDRTDPYESSSYSEQSSVLESSIWEESSEEESLESIESSESIESVEEVESSEQIEVSSEEKESVEEAESSEAYDPCGGKHLIHDGFVIVEGEYYSVDFNDETLDEEDALFQGVFSKYIVDGLQNGYVRWGSAQPNTCKEYGELITYCPVCDTEFAFYYQGEHSISEQMTKENSCIEDGYSQCLYCPKKYPHLAYGHSYAYLEKSLYGNKVSLVCSTCDDEIANVAVTVVKDYKATCLDFDSSYKKYKTGRISNGLPSGHTNYSEKEIEFTIANDSVYHNLYWSWEGGKQYFVESEATYEYSEELRVAIEECGNCWAESLDSSCTEVWLKCACGEAVIFYVTGWENLENGEENEVPPEQPLPEDNTTYERLSDGTINFGSYPQSKVTDSALTTALTSAAGALPTASNSQSWTSYKYYIGTDSDNSGVNTTDYMWYQDVAYDGNMYRGVYFTSYRPYRTDYSSNTNNSYQDDNGYMTSTVYWFAYEVLNWTVLEEKDGTAFLLCNNIIDSQEYYHNCNDFRSINGTSVYPNNYAESNIRKWLNETFYDTAFTSLQQSLISVTEVDNSAKSANPYGQPNYWNGGINNYACENTKDKIFLLSEEELTNPNYGFSSKINEYGSASYRMRKASDYAKSQGCHTHTNAAYLGNGYWWMRSPFHEYNNGVHGDAMVVHQIGFAQNLDDVSHTRHGVVPALKILL